MNSPTLDRLKGDALAGVFGIVPPPAVLRQALQRIPDVLRVSWAVRRGQVTEQMVRDFAAAMTADYQPGKLLPGDLALATLAVALEPCGHHFAEEYLCDLARLKLAEMPHAIRVAQECLKARYTLPMNETRRFKYPLSLRVIPRRPLAARVRVNDRPRSMNREMKYSSCSGV